VLSNCSSRSLIGALPHTRPFCLLPRRRFTSSHRCCCHSSSVVDVVLSSRRHFLFAILWLCISSSCLAPLPPLSRVASGLFRVQTSSRTTDNDVHDDVQEVRSSQQKRVRLELKAEMTSVTTLIKHGSSTEKRSLHTKGYHGRVRRPTLADCRPHVVASCRLVQALNNELSRLSDCKQKLIDDPKHSVNARLAKNEVFRTQE
jgi:hypothetical protein